MNILVTGAAGYIGSELIRDLLAEGHRVVAYDSLLYDVGSLLRYAGDENLAFVRGDVRDRATLSGLVTQSDIIIPLAALVGYPLCEERPQEALEVNYETNRWLAAVKSNDQRIIYPCTNSGYGTSIDGSVRTEDSPLNPVSFYGRTKVDAEEVYRSTTNCTTFRLATVYGPSSRMRTDLLVNNFVLRALRDKVLVLYECEFMRNYVHVVDVCSAFIHVINNWDSCKEQTYNVGNDALNMNKLQLAQQIKHHIPLEIIQAEFTKDPDVRDYVVSSEKFYGTGFECHYDLDEGIRQLKQVYKMIEEPWYANY